MRLSFPTPKEIARGLKRIWESKMGTPSSERIIQDDDMALKELEIFYRANGAAVEGLASNKGKGRKCEITKKMFLHSDLLKLCLKKKRNINEFFPDTTVFYD